MHSDSVIHIHLVVQKLQIWLKYLQMFKWIDELKPKWDEANQSSSNTVWGFSIPLLKVAWLIMADLDSERYFKDIRLECFWEYASFWIWDIYALEDDKKQNSIVIEPGPKVQTNSFGGLF